MRLEGVTMFRPSVTRALVTTVALFGALACGNKSKDEAKPPATIKIGLIASFSGPFADIGKQIENGIKAYLKEHGDTVAGKKIEILRRDTTGPEGEVAKRLAQELVSRDKVDFLVGFGLTPEALGAAPVATEGKTPMIIMNRPAVATTQRLLTLVSRTSPTFSAKQV